MLLLLLFNFLFAVASNDNEAGLIAKQPRMLLVVAVEGEEKNPRKQLAENCCKWWYLAVRYCLFNAAVCPMVLVQQIEQQ